MSKISSIYLSRAEYDRLREVCEKEGCKPYSFVKRVLLDHLWAYPLENLPASENDALKPDLGEVDIMGTPELEASKMDAEEVEARVRKILEGK